MTVGEMIEELQKVDQHRQVWLEIEGAEGNISEEIFFLTENGDTYLDIETKAEGKVIMEKDEHDENMGL